MSKAAELANLIGNINMGGGGVGRNLFINGAMNVAQRSTSETGLGATAGYYTLDRWKTDFSSTGGRLTMTQDSSAPSGFANSLKVACTTTDTSIAAGEQFTIEQSIEAQNCQSIAKGTADAKPLTLSFYCKANANATYVAELYAQDVDRRISSLFSVTTDWTRVEITFPADTTGVIADDNGSGIKVGLWLHAGSTYSGGTLQTTWAAASDNTRATGGDSFFDSTNRTFFITGVQLEVGEKATAFEHEPFGTTLKKASRYYTEISRADNNTAHLVGYVQTAAVARYSFHVPMRTTPSITETNFMVMHGGGSEEAVTSVDDITQDEQFVSFRANVSANLTSGQAVALYSNGAATLTFDAEL